MKLCQACFQRHYEGWSARRCSAPGCVLLDQGQLSGPARSAVDAVDWLFAAVPVPQANKALCTPCVMMRDIFCETFNTSERRTTQSLEEGATHALTLVCAWRIWLRECVCLLQVRA